MNVKHSAARTWENEQNSNNESQGYTGHESLWEKITARRGTSDEIGGLSMGKARAGEKG